MSGWSEVFLGVIAVATLAMAIGLVAMFVAASRLARRLAQFLDQVDAGLKPVFGHLNAIGRDASRAAALANAQVERVDRLVTELGQKIDETIHTVQTRLARPAREGFAIVSGIAAAVRAVRDARAGRARGDDEDPLFI